MEAEQTEFERRTTPFSRALFPVVSILLIGAVGLTVVDLVGQSDRETTRLVGGIAFGSVAARDFGYVPRLVVAKEHEVRLTIHDQGAHTHTFTIDSLGVDRVIQRGETVTVTLHLSRSGRFEFYCRFHQAFGMRGHIVAR